MTRSTIRPEDPYLLVAGVWYFNVNKAERQADVADSVAERAKEQAALTGERRADPTILAGFLAQITYAQAVRDVLRWLTGEPPAEQLTATLDLTPED